MESDGLTPHPNSRLRIGVAEIESSLSLSRLRISRMSVHGFIACQANISVDVGPRFHGMPVQDDAGWDGSCPKVLSASIIVDAERC
jgi:hypothetical protein